MVFVHVVSAVLAIGPLFLLMPIIKRLRNADLPIENAYLTIIKVIIRLVMHAGHLLVLIGRIASAGRSMAMEHFVGPCNSCNPASIERLSFKWFYESA